MITKEEQELNALRLQIDGINVVIKMCENMINAYKNSLTQQKIKLKSIENKIKKLEEKNAQSKKK